MITNDLSNRLLKLSEDGLFPKEKFEKEIKSGDFNERYFQKKDFKVRIPKLTDIPDLLELELQCWAEDLRIDSDEIERRINSKEFDLFVIEYEGSVVAVNYTHRINKKDLNKLNSKNLSLYSNTEGDAVQLIALNVLPSFQDKAWGSDLLEFVLQYFSLNKKIKSIFAITRCRDFYKSGLSSLQEYFKSIYKNGKFNDPILNFHQGHGATVLGLVKNYRIEDFENHGYGILIRYTPEERKWGWHNHHIVINYEQYDGKKQILDFISSKVDERFSENAILSKIGLDSLDLTELVVLVNNITNKNISFEKINGITTSQLLELVLDKDSSNEICESKETSDSLLKRVQSGIKKYPELVPLSIEGKGPCTFWIHPLSGDVGVYKDISSYAKGKFKVIGIKSKGLLSKTEMPFENINDMTEYYLKIIQHVQPKGPYHLAGFSLGGTIAYELTRKLQQLGEDVKHLIMVESLFVSLAEDGQLFDITHRNNFIMNANFLLMTLTKEGRKTNWITHQELESVSEDELVEELANLLKQKGVRNSIQDIKFKITSMARVHYSNLSILKSYRPKPLLKPKNVNCIQYVTYEANATSKVLWNPDYLEKVQDDKGSMLPLIKNWDSILPDVKVIKIGGESHLDIFSSSENVEDFVLNLSAIFNDTNECFVDKAQSTDIAIIGMSGRFPGADNILSFWNNLKHGVSSILYFPDNRNFDIDDFFDFEMKKPGKTYSKWGGFLNDINKFDSLFFNISPKEANLMDPSERIFLEESWKAIEDAGYDPESLSGKKWGVFSCAKGDYSVKLWEKDSTYYMPTSSYPAGRLSYYLNLTGPSMSIDTACSSTLTALAIACDNLILKNCETAIVGGGGINSTPNVMISSSQSLLFSPKGECCPFDEKANGTVMGEAICSVVLKPKEKAIEDGNHIYGVIKGWGVNQDGKTNGQTAPNGKAQSTLQKNVYEKFNINPKDITLVEAHGTGTKIGDQVEFNALTESFKSFTNETNFCSLGSVKANVGHTFFASGLVSVIKVMMAIRHKKIPPLINFNNPHPKIDIASSPFYFSKNASDWNNPDDKKPRMAAINSFGATGTNAHVVIEEYINEEKRAKPTENLRYAVIVSARKKSSLESNVAALKETIETTYLDNSYLPSISATLQLGRAMMTERVGFLVKDINDLITKFEKFLNNENNPDIYFGNGEIKKYYNQKSLPNSIESQEKLLKLWIGGYKVNWSLSYESIPLQVSLPTYCFHETSQAKNNKSSGVNKSKEWDKDIHVFSEEWIETDVIKEEFLYSKNNVYFINNSDDKAIINRITKQKQFNDSKSVFVSNGSSYKKIDNENYIINKEDNLSYVKVFEDIVITTGEIDNVLFLWPLTSTNLYNEYKSIVNIIQAINNTNFSVRKILLTGIKRDALSRSYIDSWIGFERSLVNKLEIKVVAFEEQINNFTCSNEKIIEKSLAEAEFESKSVTYQGDKRYELKLIKQNLNHGESPIKQGGTYLISGGLGGLGFLFSKYLSQKYKANLILIGRSQHDNKQEELLYEINSLGGKAKYFSGDITNENEVTEIFKLGEKKFGNINGVIHAAGLANQSSVFNKTINEFERTLAPKVKGSIVLQKISKSKNLDFICNFSSSAALLGDFGVCDYSVANKFLMSFDSNQESSTKVLSINWPLWRNGGMGLGDEKDQFYIEKTGQKLLEDHEGMKLFESLLIQNLNQYLVLSGEKESINNFLQRVLNNNKKDTEIVSSIKKSNIEKHSNVFTNHEFAAELKKIVGEVQNISPSEINDNEDLSVYGVDSISMFDIAKKINDNFQANLSAPSFVGMKSIKEIGDLLLSQDIVLLSDENLLNTKNTVMKNINFESERKLNANFSEKLKVLVQKDIISIISETQCVPISDISVDKYIGEYGIDSIGLFDIAKRLSGIFDMNLSASDLISCNTISEISTYLLDKFFDTMSQYYFRQNMVHGIEREEKYQEENILKHLEDFLNGSVDFKQLLKIVGGSE